MTQLCIAASIAAQVATVLGARHATRARRLRDARAVTIADFTLAHDSYFACSLRGERGPIAQKAAQMFVDDQRSFHNHRAAS